MPTTQTFAPARKGTASLYTEEALHNFTQFINRFPDPDEMLRKAGLSRAHLRTLEYDDEVSQCIDTRREALIAVPWRLEPQQGRTSRKLTAILEPHIEGIIRGAFNAVLYGYSVQEVVYRRTTMGIGIEFCEEKPLEWFYIRGDGELMYRSQDGTIDAPCDPRKYLLTRRQPSYRQHYGESLLSRLYWTVFFRGHGRKFWAKFLERFGEPLLIGKVADQEKFIRDVAALGLAAGLPVQPQDEVVSVAVTQSGEFERFENALSRSIQKAILGQTLTSDVGSSGSFAAAKVHDSVRQDKRNADIRLVTQTAQRLIDTLCSLNGWQAPLFVMADGTGLEMERAQRDALLVEKGVLKLTKDYLLDRYDFEEGDFEIVESAPQPEPAKVGPDDTVAKEDGEATEVSMAASLTMRPKKITFTPQQQAIEDEADALLAKAPEPIPVDTMLSAVKAATDPADLAVRLSLLLDQQDPRFTELLARAQFAAQTLGYVVAEKESPQPAKADQQPIMPAVNLSITAPITMAAQEPQTVNVQLEAQPVNVTVNVPEQPSPVVNLRAGDVTVQVPEQSAPIINLEVQPAPISQIEITSMPTRETYSRIDRDSNGNIMTSVQTEQDK